MQIKMLDEKYHVDRISECRCRYVKSDTEYFRPHYHNYYELFLTVRGEGIHIINDGEQRLVPGNLLFIRDFDVHDYICTSGNSFEFLNISFSSKTLKMLLEYLGEGFVAENLLKSKMPPMVTLSEREKNKLFFEMSELTATDNPLLTKLKMRTLLVKIFTTYFFNYSEEDSGIPLWLELTYEKMLKPENFIAGTDRMRSICGKSREHLSRSFKTFYNMTPSEFVTELRLNHSSNLLSSSNLSVTDICFECGFENLSWFYKLFSKKYGVTPRKYREELQK